VSSRLQDFIDNQVSDSKRTKTPDFPFAHIHGASVRAENRSIHLMWFPLNVGLYIYHPTPILCRFSKVYGMNILNR
jgi:hypothetical protein